MPAIVENLQDMIDYDFSVVVQPTSFQAVPPAIVSVLASLRETFHEIAQAIVKAYHEVVHFPSEHPFATVGIVLGVLLVIAMVIAPAVVAAGLLQVLGFGIQGGAGIVRGTLAAGWMVSNTVGGGLYATLQSAAMGGYGLAVVVLAIQGVGVVLLIVLIGLGIWLILKKASAGN